MQRSNGNTTLQIKQHSFRAWWTTGHLILSISEN